MAVECFDDLYGKIFVKHAADSGAAVRGMKCAIIVYSLFSLREEGAKKKAKQKRNAVREISLSAQSDESSALDSQAFGKA